MTSTAPKLLLLLVTVICYWLVCFAPYHWNAPARFTLNDAQMVQTLGDNGESEQALRFDGAGLAEFLVEDSPSWQIAPTQLSLRLRIECSREQQFGPARIVSLSKDTVQRLFTLGQDGDALVLRLLRPDSDLNGIPDFRVPRFFSPCRSRLLQLRLGESSLALLADGLTVLEVPAPQASTARWRERYPLLLGNEASWDRGWEGQLSNFELVVNNEPRFVGWSDLRIPIGGWSLSSRVKAAHRFTLIPFSKHNENWLDNVLNVLGFLPFGALLALAWPAWRNPMIAVAASAALSGSIELGQIGFEGRFPSATDLVTNTFGGWIGFLFCRFLKRRFAGNAPQAPP